MSFPPPLAGYNPPLPLVFAGVFPMAQDDYPHLRTALEKLSLNDAALTWEPETSGALGNGFRCGLLGKLHLEITVERLEREFDLELVVTTPSVPYELDLTDGAKIKIETPADWPDPSRIREAREPICAGEILVPKDFVGEVTQLLSEMRGVARDFKYLSETQLEIPFRLPLASLVTDFFDELKGRTKGYASLTYRVTGFEPEDLVKLDFLLAGDPVSAFARIVPRSEGHRIGTSMCRKLKELVPRQQFAIAVQAAIGAAIIARETIPAFRKDVTGYLYGGDITRKKKLLEKQKRGKKRMKQMGKVALPSEVFFEVMKG